jgi:hypothetical protein
MRCITRELCGGGGKGQSLNRRRPTNDVLIEGRARKKMQDYKTAVSLYSQALAILTDKSTGYREQAGDMIRPKHTIETLCTQPEETLVWT